jgi:serine carboxypeptidase-like clade I
MLTQRLLDAKIPKKISGMALGDACMGVNEFCGNPLRGPWYNLLFLAGHGCSSVNSFENVLTACPLDVLKYSYSTASPACVAAVNVMYAECPSNAYYGYNFEDQCMNNDVSPRNNDSSVTISSTLNALQNSAIPPPSLPPPSEPTGYPCGGGNALTTWITHPQVKAALHVPADAQFFGGDNGDGMVYNLTWESNVPFLQRLYTGVDGVRTLIYSGDVDPGVSSFISENITFSLGLGTPIQTWRAWTQENATDVVLGEIVRWKNTSTVNGMIDFVTLRGSGHMVPRFRPWAAYQMLRHWLYNEEYPVLPPPSNVKKFISKKNDE